LRGTRGLAEAFGVVLDVAHTLNIAYKQLQLTFAFSVDMLERGLDDVVRKIHEAADMIPGVDLTEVRVNALFQMAKRRAGWADDIRVLKQELADLFLDKTPSERIGQFFDDIERRAKEAQDVIKNSVATALPAGVESALHQVGSLFARSANVAALAGAGAGQLAGALTSGRGQRAHVGIIERDTREGFAFARGGSGNDPMKKLADNARKQTDLQTNMVNLLKEGAANAKAAMVRIVKESI
jgi:hypothetical protein